MRISDWSSDVCSSDLAPAGTARGDRAGADVRRTAADRPDHPSRGAARVALKEGRLTQRHEGTKLPSVPFVLSLSKHSSSFRRRKGRTAPFDCLAGAQDRLRQAQGKKPEERRVGKEG